VQRVYELDSGHKNKNTKTESEVIRSIDDEIISKIEAEMAIVIPIKGERLKLLEGVLSGIPHDCLTIIVSNSPREPIDRYKLEKQAFEQFNRFTEKKSVIIHQKDPGLAKALEGVEYPDLFDSEGKIRNGKGEGMFIGMLLSKMMGKKYVGFVDSDNYVPGAVNEYTKIFSSGIALSTTPYTMVRVSWIYKPKISESGVRFSKLGRVSEMTNQFLNLMISYYTGFETEVIRTGNSGEHCMSVQLAELLTYSSGFSIEPYEIVNLLEQFGGITPPEHKDTMEKGVEVMQIETRNPHFHEEKGDLHIKEMFSQGWGSIFHSKLCHPELREKLKAELVSRGILDKVKEPPQLPKMRPFIDIDISKFEKILKEQTNSLSIFE
jgi:mannosyl-3-phosphoglycerate synthase